MSEEIYCELVVVKYFLLHTRLLDCKHIGNRLCSWNVIRNSANCVWRANPRQIKFYSHRGGVQLKWVMESKQFRGFRVNKYVSHRLLCGSLHSMGLEAFITNVVTAYICVRVQFFNKLFIKVTLFIIKLCT